MNVIVASEFGMCFGVRDALAEAHRVASPRDTTVYGELVHNRQVVGELETRGFSFTDEADRSRVPDTPKVLITAHGISDRERRRLTDAGKALIDTTCPLVHRVHLIARRLGREGYFVIVIGKRGHVEVRGIVGDLDASLVVEGPDEIAQYDAARIGVVCQTTTPPSVADEVRAAIVAGNPSSEVRFIDTICHPTRARQDAVRELLDKVDALVVVGGPRSNNTRELANLARRYGVPALQVERPDDLDPQWFRDHLVVGLTAGTSTPDATVRAVHQALLDLAPPGATDSSTRSSHYR